MLRSMHDRLGSPTGRLFRTRTMVAPAAGNFAIAQPWLGLRWIAGYVVRLAIGIGSPCLFLGLCCFSGTHPLRAAESLKGVRPTEDDGPADPGHSIHGEAFDQGPRQAAYLMPGMGNVHWKVSVDSPLAQRFFDQGIGQLHGFWYFEAERSFRQVAALDPDCAMAYWGMARANMQNQSRARGFIDKAVERQSQASPLERQLITSLEKLLKGLAGGKAEAKRQAREAYVKTLEELSLDHPTHIELKAMLVLQAWENEKDGLKIQSRLAIDAILDQIFRVNPRHPAHHFRIHLWDNARRERALASAAACGPAASGIAHMWHMPGHTYSGLKRYRDAAWQQEASARVDHAHMIRDRVLPDQIHNFAHNNEWLIRNWLKIGQVQRAVDLAKNMGELPRHPKYNTLEKGSANYGRQRLLDSLTAYAMWPEFIALADTVYLEATGREKLDDERLAWLAIAHSSLGNSQKFAECQSAFAARSRMVDREQQNLEKDLAALLASPPKNSQRAPGKQRAATRQPPALRGAIPWDEFDWDETETVNLKPTGLELTDSATRGWGKLDQEKAKKYKELQQRGERLSHQQHAIRAYQAAAAKDFGQAVAWARGADKMVPATHRLEWYAQVMPSKQVLSKAEELLESAKGELLPLATAAWVAWKVGDQERTKEWLTALFEVAGVADPQLEVLKRLQPAIQGLGLEEEAKPRLESASDLGERPALDSLGPERWSPPRAPAWSLVDADQRSFSSHHFRNRPYILVFYLGLGCLHCVEQLQKLSPELERFRGLGYELVAISSESLDSLREGLANYSQPMPIPLLPNAELDVFREFRCFDDFENQPLHGTFVIDGQGRVRWQDISAEPFMDVDFLLSEVARLDKLP
jgi:peroxiredoxin